MIKKQVIDLFSAVCVYSSAGHSAALDALDYFKIRTGGYRCSVLVSELNLNGASGEYKAAVLSLVNCLILGTEVLRLRHSIRNELIGKAWFSLS
jgi:hypothetical protein